MPAHAITQTAVRITTRVAPSIASNAMGVYVPAIMRKIAVWSSCSSRPAVLVDQLPRW